MDFKISELSEQNLSLISRMVYIISRMGHFISRIGHVAAFFQKAEGGLLHRHVRIAMLPGMVKEFHDAEHVEPAPEALAEGG